MGEIYVYYNIHKRILWQLDECVLMEHMYIIYKFHWEFIFDNYEILLHPNKEKKQRMHKMWEQRKKYQN